jgi:hypothetical protein
LDYFESLKNEEKQPLGNQVMGDMQKKSGCLGYKTVHKLPVYYVYSLYSLQTNAEGNP